MATMYREADARRDMTEAGILQTRQGERRLAVEGNVSHPLAWRAAASRWSCWCGPGFSVDRDQLLQGCPLEKFPSVDLTWLTW